MEGSIILYMDGSIILYMEGSIIIRSGSQEQFYLGCEISWCTKENNSLTKICRVFCCRQLGMHQVAGH